MKRLTGAVAATSLLFASCTPPQPNGGEIMNSRKQLQFITDPTENFSVAECSVKSDTWATISDVDPSHRNRDNDFSKIFTLGSRALRAPVEPGKAALEAGATIEKLGAYTYRVADSGGSVKTVDVMKDGPFAEVISGPKNKYSLVLSINSPDSMGAVWTRIDCLPDFNFHGSSETVVPLTPDTVNTVPIVEPATTTTTAFTA